MQLKPRWSRGETSFKFHSNLNSCSASHWLCSFKIFRVLSFKNEGMNKLISIMKRVWDRLLKIYFSLSLDFSFNKWLMPWLEKLHNSLIFILECQEKVHFCSNLWISPQGICQLLNIPFHYTFTFWLVRGLTLALSMENSAWRRKGLNAGGNFNRCCRRDRVLLVVENS